MKFFHKMVWQKLDYMHRNPVSGKWKLADDFTKYPHSSAGYYELGVSGKFDEVHYRDLQLHSAFGIAIAAQCII
ncbi:MAG: hypothetical protein KF687_06470 [Cyclobacteriaceae bacterium]|nr:hypothetical protein [Cyclobacteriaceae bacterium]